LIRFFQLGFFIGLIFWSISISWVYEAINFYGAGSLLSFFMTALIICYLSLYFGLFGIAIKYFEKSKLKILILPSVFFILEWVRSWMLSGFPGQNLGILFDHFWGLLPIIGVAGTSFIIILVICIIVEKLRMVYKVPISSILILLLLFGPGHYQNGGSEKLRVSVVQPLSNDIYLLKEITNKTDTDIVVWPESVSWYNEDIFNGIEEKTIIGGFFRKDGENTYGSIINNRTQHVYDKRNLVPFGEFQPFGDLLRPLSNFFNIPDSSLSQGSYDQDKSDWSGLVCWEIVFNNTFVNRVKGTEYIVHISNDSWYGDSMPELHLKHARARAVESNKWVVRSTTDGISQIISPRKGESSEKINRGEVGYISHEITLNKNDTWYVRMGDLPLLAFSFITLLITLIIDFRKKYES
tara:strand:- start:6066 stop:7292 length:1227 start_codon:yes stop_codon:yes gene_type:complete